MSGGTSTSGIPGLKVLGKIDLDAGSRRGNGRRGGDSRTVMIPTAREDVQTTVRTDRVPIAREMNATVEEMAAKM